MKRLMIMLIMLSLTSSLKAQILDPVHWSYGYKKINPNEAILFIKATIADDWHIYSLKQLHGPVKTSFEFTRSSGYVLMGKPSEPKPMVTHDKTFDTDIHYFIKEVIFQQKIRLIKQSCSVNGALTFMACNDHQCLPPETIDFNIAVN